MAVPVSLETRDSTTSDGRPSEQTAALVADLLRQRFGDRLTTSVSACEQHGHTTTWLPNQPPQMVVFAETTDEVAEIVRIAAPHRMPVIPFGAGSSLEGHLNAPFGGLSIDMSRMNRIVEVNAEDMDCRVEAGVTRKTLNAYLRDTGLFFPIDPGADATIGGMAATRASGTNAVRYGTMRQAVLGLTAVLADGTVVHTGSRARKSSAGYDLTGLLVGSEGTLGVITEIDLRLAGIPEAVSGGICPFPDIRSACTTVIETIQMGIPVARIELLDEVQMRMSAAYSKIDLPDSPALFLEFHGTDQSAREQSTLFGEIAEANGGGPFHWTTDAEERSRLWQARHDAYWSVVAATPGLDIVATDVCVPISRLADCVAETRAEIDERGLVGPIVGHVGDGNFHVSLAVDMADAQKVASAKDFVHNLTKRAMAMDGTCTGEHGVGQGKMQYLVEEHGPAVLEMMRAVKKAIDPQNILNPGKIFEIQDSCDNRSPCDHSLELKP